MKRPTELDVPLDAAGERLDVWLSGSLAAHSRSAIALLVDDGLVTVDGRTRPRSFRLEGGEHVQVTGPEVAEPQQVTVEPAIVFEDELLLVVDKPAGLVVHPARGHSSRTLVELLRDRAGAAWKPELVHRLDRDTSGLMLVAKDERTRDLLQAQLRARELEREYIGLASGRLESRTGTIEAPIGRDRSNRARMSVDTAKPRDAITHFEVERFVGENSLLRLRLETGRTHQIRAHLAAIGHPVCGDPEYGGRGKLGLKRQFLHSSRIAFSDPQTGERREIRSRLPGDLQRVLDLTDDR